MTRKIRIEKLTREAFAPFGEVLDTSGAPDKLINQGLCGRYHDRATLDFVEGHAGISLFQAELRSLRLNPDFSGTIIDGPVVGAGHYEAGYDVISLGLEIHWDTLLGDGE